LRDWAVLIGSDRDREVKVMWAHAGRDRMMGCLFALFVGCSPRLRTAPSWVKRAAESSDTSRPSDGRSDLPRVLGGVVPQHGERGVGKKRYRSVDTGDDLPTDRHMRPDPHQGRRTTN